ncbi:MAG: efflux RND transporter permease subunit, partial [bacterium]|nr:efflux RND transporter permease subunit [bacterium]
MKKIIDRPVLAVIFFAIIILFGFYSYNNMTIGLVPAPDESLPMLSVSYVWQGVSPDVILQEVLIPAENEVMKKVKGIEKLTSRAENGRGEMNIEFNRQVKMNFAELVLRETLNRLQKDLPEAVILVGIRAQVPQEFEQKPLMRIGIYGEKYSVFQLRKIAEREIQPYLRSISGVESAMLYGGVEPEIKISTRLESMKTLKISINFITTQIYRYFY